MSNEIQITAQQDINVHISEEQAKKLVINFLRDYFDFPKDAEIEGNLVFVEALERLEEGFRLYSRELNKFDKSVFKILHFLSSGYPKIKSEWKRDV